jgi:hypothetical protein
MRARFRCVSLLRSSYKPPAFLKLFIWPASHHRHLITDIEMALVGWSVGSRAALIRFLWAAESGERASMVFYCGEVR